VERVERQQADHIQAAAWDLFSDGSPSREDVAFTMQRLMDPALHSSTGDAFRSGSGTVSTKIIAPDQIAITFPRRWPDSNTFSISGDHVRALSQERGGGARAVHGGGIQGGVERAAQAQPQLLEERRCGTRLPYLDSVRLDIQPNRDVEMLRFKRGELDLINSVDSDYFDRLAASHRNWCTMPALRSITIPVVQPGGQRSIPEYKRAWFRSVNFRARFRKPSTATI